MDIHAHFDHYNINVADLEKSIEFYRKALGLRKISQISHPMDEYKIVFMSNPGETFKLELTWLHDHPQPYDLGEGEFHLCMRVEGDYDEVREYHRQMGCICFENHDMGLYFIADPDGYWTEILPVK